MKGLPPRGKYYENQCPDVKFVLPFESEDTNVPMAEEPPCAFSSNWTSDTIIDDSKTLPQFVHTASALDGSKSMSVDPHDLHFI